MSHSYRYLDAEARGDIFIVTLRNGEDNRLNFDICKELMCVMRDIRQRLKPDSDGALIVRGNNKFFTNVSCPVYSWNITDLVSPEGCRSCRGSKPAGWIGRKLLSSKSYICRPGNSAANSSCSYYMPSSTSHFLQLQLSLAIRLVAAARSRWLSIIVS